MLALGGARLRAKLFRVILLAAALAVPSPAAARAVPTRGAGDLTVSRLPVKEGTRGPDVRRIQARLKELGFDPGPLDGVFGPRTREAVLRFQQARHLPTVGFVGPRTLAALRAEASAPRPATGGASPARGGARPSSGGARPASRLPLPAPDIGGDSRGTGGRLALTFDDGPDPSTLPAILQALAQHGERATFFVVGRLAEAHPELLRRMAEAGDEVENHGYSHQAAIRLSSRDLEREIARTAEVVARATGRRPTFYRPAGGDFTADTVRAAEAAGHHLILWSNIGAPDVPYPGDDALVQRLAAAAYDGAIIMLHADRPETARVLPAVLSAWEASGFRCVTLAELVGSR